MFHLLIKIRNFVCKLLAKKNNDKLIIIWLGENLQKVCSIYFHRITNYHIYNASDCITFGREYRIRHFFVIIIISSLESRICSRFSVHVTYHIACYRFISFKFIMLLYRNAMVLKSTGIFCSQNLFFIMTGIVIVSYFD